MIDLKNTYILNDNGELRDLYVKECEKQGIPSYRSAAANEVDFNYLYVKQLCAGLTITSVMGCDEGCVTNHKQITIADLKPRTKVEYVRCEFNHAWEALKEFQEDGGLFLSTGSSGTFIPPNDIYQAAGNHLNLYRKVEREITWQDELKDWCSKEGVNIAVDTNNNLVSSGWVGNNQFIEICHLVSKLNK